jgi:hypothetical protein
MNNHGKDSTGWDALADAALEILSRLLEAALALLL